MPLDWMKPQEVPNMGMVYLSKCRLFMIIHTGDKSFKLSYSGPPYEILGKHPSLKAAKKAAEIKRALCG